MFSKRTCSSLLVYHPLNVDKNKVFDTDLQVSENLINFVSTCSISYWEVAPWTFPSSLVWSNLSSLQPGIPSLPRLCVYSLIFSKNSRKPLCRYLDLFLCIASSCPVFCPGNYHQLSLPDFKYLSRRVRCAPAIILTLDCCPGSASVPKGGAIRAYFAYFPCLRGTSLILPVV